MTSTKICSKCKIEKITSDFAKRGKNGWQATCKVCAKLYKDQNKQRIIITNKSYYENNKDHLLPPNRIYNQKYHLLHKVNISENKKAYYKENKDQILSKKYKRDKIRRKIDISFRLRGRIATTIRFYLKLNYSSKNKISILKHLTYTMQELKAHLESQFEPWMSWDNYGVYRSNIWLDNDSTTWKWNIDHIIPQSNLPYTSMTDDNFSRCWALDNLRPLSAKQNTIDGASKIRHSA